MGAIKGDTRSLDNGSYIADAAVRFLCVAVHEPGFCS